MIDHPTLQQRITQDPAILGGKTVIRGMRIPVTLIVDFVASGSTVEEILDAYPVLTEEDIEAALAYAKAQAERTEVRAL